MTRRFGRFLRQNTIALLALFVALSGTTMAAETMINGSQIKPHTIAKNRLTKRAITQLKGNRGPQGPRGATGPQGLQGSPGPFPPTLPSGKTLRGVFYAQGTSTQINGFVGDNISFGWTLSAKPTAHFIEVGAAVPAGCSGNAATPGASPGNLCVFEDQNNNIADAADSIAHLASYGAGVFTETAASGQYNFGGSWAVTAP